MSWKSAMGKFSFISNDKKTLLQGRHARPMRQKSFESNVEEILPHRGLHGGAPWMCHVMEKRHREKLFPF